MKVSFRSIKTEDFEFLWKLHNLALKHYVSEVWGWDEKLQQKLFRDHFKRSGGQIVLIDEKNAGFLEVIDSGNETLLSSIRLLPEFQNRGIGTIITQNIIADARQKNHCVRLQVLKINPARLLYERLGFSVFDETETHFQMRLK